MRKHQVQPVPIEIPLAEPMVHPALIEGVAATAHIDLDRMQLKPFCFGTLKRERVRLLYKHDPTQIAGKIQELHWDDRGQLLLKAVVTHDQAKRCSALSVGFRVIAYSLHDPDSDRFYARIEQAELTEVSLVTHPSNPAARITSRCRQPPQSEFYSLMQERVQRLIQLTVLMKEMNHVRRAGA
jgi:HK97 family phage prohead protease